MSPQQKKKRITPMYNHIYSIVEDFVKAVEEENLKNSKELVELANSGRFIYAATRQNMNRLMTGEQWEHLRKRNIIESDWGVLKQNYFLEYHQARSMVGLFRHYVCCISAYILECRLKSFPRIKTRI